MKQRTTKASRTGSRHIPRRKIACGACRRPFSRPKSGRVGSDINRDEYLKRINGIVYGDNPDQGVVQGRRFLHRDLRFAVDFPQGWEVNNGQAQVVAKEPGGTSLMILQLVQAPQGRPASGRRPAVDATRRLSPAQWRRNDDQWAGGVRWHL